MSKIKRTYKTFAACGEWELPEDVMAELTAIAEELLQEKYIMRLDGNPGACEAFLNACEYEEDMELYIPWENFNDHETGHHKVTAGALEQAFLHHPDWTQVGDEDARLEIGRYSYLILGKDLKSPCDFLICYSDQGKAESDDIAQVIRIADSNLIPVFDFGLGMEYATNQLTEWLAKNA